MLLRQTERGPDRLRDLFGRRAFGVDVQVRQIERQRAAALVAMLGRVIAEHGFRGPVGPLVLAAVRRQIALQPRSERRLQLHNEPAAAAVADRPRVVTNRFGVLCEIEAPAGGADDL